MASCSVKFYGFEPVMAGVRKVLKSDGVKTLLASQGAKGAAAANKEYSFYEPTKAAPYAYKVSTGLYTSYAVVHVNSKLGKLDNQKNGTLRKVLLDE